MKYCVTSEANVKELNAFNFVINNTLHKKLRSKSPLHHLKT